MIPQNFSGRTRKKTRTGARLSTSQTISSTGKTARNGNANIDRKEKRAGQDSKLTEFCVPAAPPSSDFVGVGVAAGSSKEKVILAT